MSFQITRHDNGFHLGLKPILFEKPISVTVLTREQAIERSTKVDVRGGKLDIKLQYESIADDMCSYFGDTIDVLGFFLPEEFHDETEDPKITPENAELIVKLRDKEGVDAIDYIWTAEMLKDDSLILTAFLIKTTLELEKWEQS